MVGENARAAGVEIDVKHGNASAMPFGDNQFDYIVCRAAFKNFSDPLGAINECHRVLVPRGVASIIDLRKDASKAAIRAEVNAMNLSRINALWTMLTFRTVLLKRAYTVPQLEALVAKSRFGKAEIIQEGIGFDMRFTKE